jgi:hypothetical protein
MLPDPDPGDIEPRILDGERLFLRALLTSPDGTATLTDATPSEFMHAPFPDGGKWRGAIPQRLAGRGIITPMPTPCGRLSAHRSGRKARRRGIAGVWKLIDPDAGRRRLQDLDDYFRQNPGGHPRRPSLFDYLDDDRDAGPVPC